MSRYIDADELIKVGLQDGAYEYISVREIAEFPTADGVIKVVPCEKCFYAKPYNKVWQLPKYNSVLWCTHCREEKLPDWFCADAFERMVEE